MRQFKMASRSNQTQGFYRSLNDFNKFLEPVKKRKEIKASKRYFAVERVISKRINKGNTEYLIKWNGYSCYACSWEDEVHLTPDLISSFDRPFISESRLQEHKDILQYNLTVKLKSSSRSPHSFFFCHDVFRYVFTGKGKSSRDGKAIMLEKKDFEHLELPTAWDQSLDKNGDGMAIEYPIRLQLHLSWSPQLRAIQDGKLVVKPRMPLEKLSVLFVCQPLSANVECIQ